MVFSNSELHKALDDGRLIIDPEPSPRFPDATGKCPYQTTSVDLRLGNEISYFKEGLAISVNLLRGGFANLFTLNSESRTITDEQPYPLRPGKLVLGQTLEKVSLKLPLEDDTPALAA